MAPAPLRGVSIDSDLPGAGEAAHAAEQAVVASAIAGHAAPSHGHHSAGNSHCQNCGAALRGPYCHRCGQHDFDVNRSFWHTFLEALESFFHFDTKLFRSLFMLLFLPGRLTAAFNAGKRAAQMPPFRLYIFVSLFFFLFTNLERTTHLPTGLKTSAHRGGNAALTVNGHEVTAKQAWQAITAGETVDVTVQEPSGTDENATAPTPESPAEPAVELIDEAIPDWAQNFEEKGRRLGTAEGQEAIIHGFIAALPKLVLLCLPLFALYTRFFFRKTRQVYLQHLVLAVHFHTFIYLWLMFSRGWEHVLGFISPAAAAWFNDAANLWLFLYPVVMLHYVFGNSWFKTILKSGLFGAIYGLTLALGFFLTVLIILWVL